MNDIHTKIRALKPGQVLIRRNVEVRRLKDQDLVFKADLAVGGERDHSVLGRSSDGMSWRQAQEIVARRKADLRRNAGLAEAPASRGPRMPFRQAIELYLAQGEKTGMKNLGRRAMHARRHLIPHFKDLAIGLLSEERLQIYRQQRRQAGASDRTGNRELATLSHFLNWCATGDRKWLPHRHCAIPRTPEAKLWRDVLSAAERQALLQAALADASPLCFAFVAFLVNSPMRHAEILRARYGWIDWTNHLLNVSQAKGGPRPQPLTPELVAILAQLRQGAADPQGFIFPARRPRFAKQGHVTTMARDFRRVVERAGLDPKRVTPHLCRHTAATLLAGAGVDAFTLQKVTGHKTLAVAQWYVHVYGQQIKAAAAHLGLGLERNSPDFPPRPEAASGAAVKETAQVIGFRKKSG
jgi:integrase